MKKTRKKTSVVWVTSTDELQILLNQSSTKQEILGKMGLDGTTGGSARALNQRLESEDLNLSCFEENHKKWKEELHLRLNKGNKRSDSDIFKENSSVSRCIVKRRYLFLINKYECSKCGISDYMGKPISLQLDHINGVNNDNRLNNLRLLCPNCHSQTETFGKKNKSKNGSPPQY